MAARASPQPGATVNAGVLRKDHVVSRPAFVHDDLRQRNLGDSPSLSNGLGVDDRLPSGPTHVGGENMAALVEHGTSRESHQLCSSAGEKDLLRISDRIGISKHPPQIGDTLPTSQFRVADADRIGPRFGSMFQKGERVQGRIFRRQSCKLTQDLRRMWARWPHSCCIHEETHPRINRLKAGPPTVGAILVPQVELIQ